MTIRIKQVGANFVYETGPAIGTPVAVGGSNTQVQFNNNGIFGGDSNFVFNNSTDTLTVSNMSGSLTRLSTGVSYLVAGSNVTITSASNGQVTIASSGGGGGGDLVGPASATANAVALFDGTTGKLLKNSGLTTDGSNSLFIGGTLGISGSTTFGASALPSADMTYDLGSTSFRWANVYTGDLHLRNDRGNWTIIEEVDYLCVVNNVTGKKYKMMLQPIE